MELKIDNKEMELYIRQLEEENIRLKNSNKALRNNNRALIQGVSKLQKYVHELKKKSNNTEYISIEERKRNAKNMNELLDHLIKLIKSNDKDILLNGLRVVNWQRWKFLISLNLLVM